MQGVVAQLRLDGQVRGAQLHLFAQCRLRVVLLRQGGAQEVNQLVQQALGRIHVLLVQRFTLLNDGEQKLRVNSCLDAVQARLQSLVLNRLVGNARRPHCCHHPVRAHLPLIGDGQQAGDDGAAHSDGTIACFDSKYTYNTWRPVTAIQLADSATNPATAAEADWTPVVPTPSHPEYPAAHSCVTGAIAQTLRNYFRTNQVSVSYTSGVANTVAHSYATTEDMLADVAGARIYGGMHFRFSAVDGEKIGSKVANQVAENFFKPAN